MFTDRATYDTIVYLRPCTVEMHPSRQPNRLPIPTYPLHLHHPALEGSYRIEKTKYIADVSGGTGDGREIGNPIDIESIYTEKVFRAAMAELWNRGKPPCFPVLLLRVAEPRCNRSLSVSPSISLP